MKPEILVTTPYPPSILAALGEFFVLHKLYEAADPNEFLHGIASRVRAVATSGGKGASAALIAALPRIEIIASFSVGVDSIDLNAARARDIIVTNTPDVLTDEVADYAMALLLDSARQITRTDRWLRKGGWLLAEHPLSQGVRGKTLGILGLGKIGSTLAHRAEAFGMKVIWYGPRPKPEARWTRAESLLALAQQAQFLVAVCPLTPETRHIVDGPVLEALGPGGTFINVARGAVADETALVEALVGGKLGFAALDVFAHEPNVPEALLNLENVVLSPHMGSATVETRAAMGRLVLENLVAHFSGRPLPSRVA